MKLLLKLMEPVWYVRYRISFRGYEYHIFTDGEIKRRFPLSERRIKQNSYKYEKKALKSIRKKRKRA